MSGATYKTNGTKVLKISDVSNSELIPELKSTAQWVCYRVIERDGEETKMPVDPSNGQPANSTDSPTWSSFEAATQTHEANRVETDGIGFMFDSDGLVMGIDLDYCRDPESGEVASWAADIVSRVDSYWEVSPSGTGLHGLAYGFLPGDRTRADVPDAEGHVEMYEESRYFTVTGDHIEDTRKQVTQCKGSAAAVYEEFIGQDEDDDDTGGSSATPSAELDMDDEELIEQAKNAKNGEAFASLWNGDTSGYESHSEADMALCSYLAFWTQCDELRMDRLFQESGLMREKWDEDRGDQTYGERTIDQAVSSCSDVYDPRTGDESESASVSADGGGDEGSTIDSSVVTYLVERDGGYYRPVESEDGTKYEQVTSFVIDVNHRLKSDGEQFVDATVRSQGGEVLDVVAEMRAFNEQRDFREAFCTGFETFFDGSRQDLNELRKVVARQNAPTFEDTRLLGHQDDEFVLPDSTWGADGLLDDDATYRYRESGSSVESKLVLDGLNDVAEDDVARILELLPETRTNDRFIPVMGWFYAVPFTPLIRDIEGELPLLNVTGDAGSGKSNSIATMCRLLGLDGSPLGWETTQFSLLKHLSSTESLPVWYDEYKPSDAQDYQVDRFKNLIRSNTNGRVETRGNPDKTETEYPLVAPVVVSGEQRVSGSAEQRRSVMTVFRRTVPRQDSYRTAFHDLQDYDLSEHAKALHSFALNKDEEMLRGVWEEMSSYVDSVLDDVDGNLDDLERNGLKMIRYGMAIYFDLCNQYGADPSITNDDVRSAIEYAATHKGDANRQTHLDEFMGLVCSAVAADGYLEADTDYYIQRKNSNHEELRFKLSAAVDKVSKYVRDHDLDADLLTQEDYKERLRDEEQNDDSYVVKRNMATHKLNRCVVIDTRKADNAVPRFIRTDVAPDADPEFETDDE